MPAPRGMKRVLRLSIRAGSSASTPLSLDQGAREQIFHAIEQADILLFLADGRAGLHPEDSSIFDLLRRVSKPIFLAVNKIDGPEQQGKLADFYALGVQDIYPVSSAHGFGVGDLLSDIVKLYPKNKGQRGRGPGNPHIRARTAQRWKIDPGEPNPGGTSRYSHSDRRDHARRSGHVFHARQPEVPADRYRCDTKKGKDPGKTGKNKHCKGASKHRQEPTSASC